MKNRHKVFITLLLAMLSVSDSYGNNKLLEILANLKKVKNTNDISYSYKVYMRNYKSGRNEDSICGKIVKSADGYLDSNNSFLTIIDKESYVKVDFLNKEIFAFRLADYKKKLGDDIKYNRPFIMDVSDSMILKHGKLLSDISANGNYIVEINFKTTDLSKIIVEFSKRDYSIVSMKMEVIEKDKYATPTDYGKVYVLTNMKFGSRGRPIDPSKYCVFENGIAKAASKYTKYQLITLTK